MQTHKKSIFNVQHLHWEKPSTGAIHTNENLAHPVLEDWIAKSRNYGNDEKYGRGYY